VEAGTYDALASSWIAQKVNRLLEAEADHEGIHERQEELERHAQRALGL
jgi:hypothetical protein